MAHAPHKNPSTSGKRRAGGNNQIDPGSRSATSFFIVLALLVMAALAWSVSREPADTTDTVAEPRSAPATNATPAREGVFDPLTGTLQRADDAAALSDSRKRQLDEEIEQQ